MRHVELTATGRYFRVYKDGSHSSNHYTEREAIETAINLSVANPDSAIRFVHEYEVVVEVLGSLEPGGDSEAPSVPQNLQATAINRTQIDLSWDESTDNIAVSGYQILRDDEAIDTVNHPTTSYSDTGLSASTLYEYRVQAYDGSGNTSALSDPAQATTQENSPPVWSALPAQNFIVNQAVNIDLDDYTTDADGDSLTYSLASGVYPSGVSLSGSMLIGTPATSGESGALVFEADDTFDQVNSSPMSYNTYDPDITAPNVPASLAVTAKTVDSISLSWDATADGTGAANEYQSGVASYRLYRDGGLIVDQAGTSYQDTGRSLDVNYSYEISAVDVAGNESAKSAPLVVQIVRPTIANIPGNLIDPLNIGVPYELAPLINDPDNLISLVIQTGMTVYASLDQVNREIDGVATGTPGTPEETNVRIGITY